MSIPLLHGGGGKFRHGVLSLMIHSIDPLHEEIIANGASASRPGSSSIKGHNAVHVHPPGATSCIQCQEESIKANGNESSAIMNGTTLGNAAKPQIHQLAVELLEQRESNNNPVLKGVNSNLSPQPIEIVQVTSD